MAYKNELAHVQRQEQKITTSLIQGLQMLSLPDAAIYGYLVELSMGNPMLDIPEPPSARYEDVTAPERPGFAAMEYARERDYYRSASADPADRGDYDPYYSCGTVFEADTLTGSLELQLSMSELTPAERAVGMEIIGNIDDSGYFVGNLETICLLCCVPAETGRRVLSLIQTFSPCGIAAKDVYEALCLQVEDSFPYADVARRVIKNDLAALPSSDVGPCAGKYGVSPQCMEEVFDYIRSLEPRPGNCDERPFDVSYVSPDIVVRRDGEELHVYVSGEAENTLRVNEQYMDLLGRAQLGPEDKRYLRSCLNEARSLIRSMDIRRQTLHRFALALLTLQGDFFRFGPERLRPMTMQQMADEMGVNVSTVSRVVQDKYASTPWGEFPLKYFFARSFKGIGGDEAVSAVAVRRRISELICAEDPYEPLTDEEISAALQDEGCSISRRTVSKYRQALGFESCAKRRQKRS